MSEIINQITNLDSLTFEDARNTLAYIGIAALPVTAGLFAYDTQRNPKSSDEGMHGAEASSLEIASEVKEGRVKKRATKWGSALLITTGISLMSVNALDPQLEYEKTISDYEAMNVLDSSTSMQYTEDMTSGNTRFVDALGILNERGEFLPSDARSGVIAFGENVEVIEPFSTTKTELTVEGIQEAIDPNGGSLVESLELATNILNGSDNEGGEALVVITDGTIDTVGAASEQLNDIAAEGTKVIVGFTGTQDGSYVRSAYDTEPNFSGVNSDEFELSDDVIVFESNDISVIGDAIKDEVNKSTKRTEKAPTDIFWYTGATATAAGVGLLINRLLKRKN